MNIFWLFNHPAPYKIDFFNTLGKDVSITAVFERNAESGRNATFYGEKAEHFEAIICKSIKIGGVDNYTHKPISILKKRSFDIVVLNGWMTLTERRTIRYCRRHRIPYIFLINGGIAKTNEPRWKRKAKETFLPGAVAYLAPDENSKTYLAHYGVDANLIDLYPYSSVFASELVDHPLSVEEKKELRAELGLQGEKVFVSSGQLIERKNYKEMISHWAEMPKSSHLYITGEGPQKEELLQFIQTLHLENVHINPYLAHKDLFRFYRAADGFLFLSKEDIYGHVINEAMSQGLPVVSSGEVNAAKHLIRNGENGFLVPLHDKEAFLKAVNAIEDTFGQKALETARENTQEASAAYFLQYFEKYCKSVKETPQK